MFDFWKEVIINDEKRVKNLAEVYKNDIKKAGLRVERCADYEAKHVVDGIVYKTLPTAGKCAEITLPVEGSGRAIIELGLSVGTNSEFARPWSVFKMPIVVEFDAKHPLADGLRLAIDSHIASVKDNKLVLADPRVCVKSAIIEEAKAAEGEGKPLPTLDVTENAVPVGTGEWILENLRFPTHVNTYVGAPNADDMPQLDAEYVQYAFEYCVPKRGFHGQGAVGQAVASVTHHVFYVKKDIVANVEAAFKALTSGVEGGKMVLVNEADGADAKAEEDQEYYSTVLDKDIAVKHTDGVPNTGTAETVA